jgi:hypothetical protein
VTGSDHKSDEQQPASLKESLRPVEDLHDLLLRISHRLDYEHSERRTIHHRLLAIDHQTKSAVETLTKKRGSRTFFRYVLAICIGVAGTLAWQSSYGEATKHTVATRAPDLGWSPEAKQRIASWVEQLRWTKPLAGPENAAVQPPAPDGLQPVAAAQVAPETVASSAPSAPSPDAEQVQQIVLGLTALRQTVEQIVGGQDQMAREIARLQTADVEILERMRGWEEKFTAAISRPPPQPPAAPARKPTPISPSSRAPIPPR